MNKTICYILLCTLISLALTKEKDSKESLSPKYCNATMKAKAKADCERIACNKENTEMSSMLCAESVCPGESKGIKKGDKSKPYPECCDQPICDLSKARPK